MKKAVKLLAALVCTTVLSTTCVIGAEAQTKISNVSGYRYEGTTERIQGPDDNDYTRNTIWCQTRWIQEPSYDNVIYVTANYDNRPWEDALTKKVTHGGYVVTQLYRYIGFTTAKGKHTAQTLYSGGNSNTIFTYD